MTTPPIMSVTDELIAELDSCVRADCGVELDASDVAALLSERAELKRDAERYRWLRDPDRVPDDDPCGHLIVAQAEGEDVLWRDELDRFIDTAMANPK